MRHIDLIDNVIGIGIGARDVGEGMLTLVVDYCSFSLSLVSIPMNTICWSPVDIHFV